MGTRLEGRSKHYLGISKHTLVLKIKKNETKLGEFLPPNPLLSGGGRQST